MFSTVGDFMLVSLRMLLSALRNHEASLSEKLNDVGIDGALDNSSGPLLAADVVNGHDEITQRECLLLLNHFHGLRIRRSTARTLWGVHPMGSLQLLFNQIYATAFSPR